MRPVTGGHKRTVGHSHRRGTQYRSQVQCQPGPPGVITSGGVDEKHIGGFVQRPHCSLQNRTLTKGQVPTAIRPAGCACHAHPRDEPTLPHQGRACPPDVPLSTGPISASPEAHEDATGRSAIGRWIPRVRRRSGEGLLEARELRDGRRPYHLPSVCRAVGLIHGDFRWCARRVGLLEVRYDP